MKIKTIIKGNKTVIQIVQTEETAHEFSTMIEAIRTLYSETDQPLTLDEVAKLISSPNNTGRSLTDALKGRRSISFSEYTTAKALINTIDRTEATTHNETN